MQVLSLAHDYDTRKRTIMSKKQAPEWITLSQAAARPECKVSRQTLHMMIKRGDVPSSALDERPYGKTTITYIDANVLKDLPYRTSGQRGKARD